MPLHHFTRPLRETHLIRRVVSSITYLREHRRIRTQFVEIQNMALLGELASGVAHDFNNTLAGILGRAQLLLDTHDQEKIETGLNIIIKTARDGAKTVRRIQDFGRHPNNHDFQLVSVHQLLSDVAEITRPRWQDLAEADNIQINLQTSCANNLWIFGDESELREVLVNLIFNAIDAMPQGGELLLFAQMDTTSIEIAVSDTGTGMTDETRRRVFDPFFSTKDHLGMGLGLSVSADIIRKHEGTVDVESQLGLGSTFRIRLPVPSILRRLRTVDSKLALPHRTTNERIVM